MTKLQRIKAILSTKNLPRKELNKIGAAYKNLCCSRTWPAASTVLNKAPATRSFKNPDDRILLFLETIKRNPKDASAKMYQLASNSKQPTQGPPNLPPFKESAPIKSVRQPWIKNKFFVIKGKAVPWFRSGLMRRSER